MSKEYEIHQDGMMVAGASGKNALADALHYCAVYGQDGPVELFEVTRVQVGTDGVALAASAPNAALVAQARAQAIEECARICDDQHHKWRWDDEPDSDSGPRSCAAAIRNLKGQP